MDKNNRGFNGRSPAATTNGQASNGAPGTPFLSRPEFEAIKHDPLQVLYRASQVIAALEQQDAALEEEGAALRQQLQEKDGNTYDADRLAALMEESAAGEASHRALAVRFADTESSNSRLEKVVNRLRAEKQALMDELNSLQEENNKYVATYANLMSDMKDMDEKQQHKEQSSQALQDAIDDKITQLDVLTKDIVDHTQRSIDMQATAEEIGSERLALEAETVALEQTTQQQERTINYLQQEVTQLDTAIKEKAEEMVQMKKQMSAAVLELQLQITKAEEEMTRIHNAVANEKDLTGRQNLWLAKDLHAKTEDLLSTRQAMAKEHTELRGDLAVLREKADRLKSNTLVVEKQNQLLHTTMQHLEKEDTLSKEAYNKRKDRAFEEMNKQAAAVHQLNAELQTTRENLYVIKSKLCRDCRESFLVDNE